MAKQSKKSKRKSRRDPARQILPEFAKRQKLNLHPETKKSISALVFICLAIIFGLSAFGKAGPAGNYIYEAGSFLLGVGYGALPLLLLLSGIVMFVSIRTHLFATSIGGLITLIGALGMFDVIDPGTGGVMGKIGGLLEVPFGFTVGLVINLCIFAAGIMIAFNVPLTIPKFLRRFPSDEDEEENVIDVAIEDEDAEEEIDAKTGDDKSKQAAVEAAARAKAGAEEDDLTILHASEKQGTSKKDLRMTPTSKTYTPPPLSLLEDTSDKPSSGDIKANANIIRRTLASFGIAVEVAEIHVGPAVTRFSLRPAEGVKLSRIITLHNDLALALAAHPIRIEAPIPGKSLVGIEVPNKTSALVRLRHMIGTEAFQKSNPLTFAVGKDVSGEPVYADIAKMPHLLIAGSSGSGKSVTIHSLITGLLFRNSPENLRLILIDPKRVELSVYDGLPHMATPVIIDPKKALLALRFAIKEMDHRYDILLQKKARDILAYNKICRERKEPLLPYLVVVVDELADLMATYPREIEGAIVRLAQMARATGIHLVLSTQRPSVEVVTGLIKANITSRIALQVASQIDSRTILDNAGAEKLLGSGDLLFISGELSKPKRIQGAFLSDKEVKGVIAFIKENNDADADVVAFETPAAQQKENKLGIADMNTAFEQFSEAGAGDDDDDLYDEAVEVVKAAQKASASLLQRRLSVGYARAARLLDIMEERGVIGPGDGAKPREVYVAKDAEDGFVEEE
jgi:S-DNA-T family DNA segregation ATPase FtsK/SpoIIIE